MPRENVYAAADNADAVTAHVGGNAGTTCGARAVASVNQNSVVL